MSAREILATTYIEGHNRPIGHLHAKAIEVALTAAGFSIVHKDEIHAPSDAVVETALTTWFGADLPWHTGLSNAVVEQCIAAMRDTIAAALRELMKEVGR